MLQRLAGIVNPTLRERFGRGVVSNLIKPKVNLGLSLTTSSKKTCSENYKMD